MDNNDIDIEKGMNPIHQKNSINMAEKPKPKGIIVNNHKESYENWFVDTIIRVGLFTVGLVVFVPIIVLAFYFSSKNYDCTTHLMNINTLLICCGAKTTILFLILGARLYNESSLTTVSDKTITFFKKFSVVHFYYEVIYNSFIIYIISNMKLSNCNIVPFSYIIIYLVLNYFALFLYWISNFS